MTSVAVVGIGSWGKNLVRVFDEIASVELCCHTGSDANRNWLRHRYPSIPATTEYEQVLADDTIDAVVIATPTDTHFELVQAALDAEKHVFVEKPLTPNSDSAERLVEAAHDNGIKLFVGYVFVHHPVFRQLERIHKQTPIKQIHFEWRKTGEFVEDIIENLGSHDLAMAHRLYDTMPISLSVANEILFSGDRNIVSIDADFQETNCCRIELNRVSHTERKFVTAITETNDLFAWEGDNLWTLDPERSTFVETFTSDREPLKVECKTFLDYINSGKPPLTDGEFGARVTRMLDRIT